MAVFTVCTPRQIVLGDQTNGNKLDGACGTQEIEKRSKWENFKEGKCFADLDVDGGTKLNCILKE